jgi:hypothetical protein
MRIIIYPKENKYDILSSLIMEIGNASPNLRTEGPSG